jgi:hypothetical protein
VPFLHSYIFVTEHVGNVSNLEASAGAVTMLVDKCADPVPVLGET